MKKNSVLSSLKVKLGSLTVAIVLIPLIILGVLSYYQAKEGMSIAGLGQIKDSVDGGYNLIEAYYKRVQTREITKEHAVKEIRRFLAGRITALIFKASSKEDAINLLKESGYDFENDNLLFEFGKEIRLKGELVANYSEKHKAFFIKSPSFLNRIMDSYHKINVNKQQLWIKKHKIKILRDFSSANIKIRNSGYTWVVSGNPGGNYQGKAYEIVHPSLEGVNVWNVKDKGAIPIELGKRLADMNKKIDSVNSKTMVRLDYTWRNMGDKSDRNKIVLMRYFKPWNWVVMSGLYEDEFFATLSTIKTAILLVAVIAAVLALIIIIYINRKIILKPLDKLKKFFEHLSMGGGELDQKLEIKSKDEIGQLADSFNRFIPSLKGKLDIIKAIAQGAGDFTVDVNIISDEDLLGKSLKQMLLSLNEILNQVKTASKQILEGSKQVSEAAQTLSSGASEQAASLEQISSSVTEINSQASQNADNSIQARAVSQKAREKAKEGNDNMDQMLSWMKELNSSSEEIKKVIKVIDDIAFQTNLLALNANVEAARAGKYGKGFAVVAEEVRNLAVRSAEAAKETTSMIEKSIDMIGNGNIKMQEATDGFSEITNEITKVNDFMSEIASASREQAKGLEQIDTGLTQIEQVTQNNSASAEESAAASEELSAQAARLLEIVSQFKLQEVSDLLNSTEKNQKSELGALGQNLSPELLGQLKQLLSQMQGANPTQNTQKIQNNSASQGKNIQKNNGDHKPDIISPKEQIKLDDDEFSDF